MEPSSLSELRASGSPPPWDCHPSDDTDGLLSQHGLLILRSAIPRDLIAMLGSEVEEQTAKALHASLSDMARRLGEIREPLFRCDLMLEVSTTVAAVLAALAIACGAALRYAEWLALVGRGPSG